LWIKKNIIVLICAALFVTIGCATVPEEKPGPRALASLELTKNGKRLLESGRPDEAIRVLEQAVSIDPSNGQSYYYLSEAWLAKGGENISQAEEFNRLAGMYLASDEQWMEKVENQKAYIEKIRDSSRMNL
jgi:tetratricopeptide (TPR) repeat protein